MREKHKQLTNRARDHDDAKRTAASEQERIDWQHDLEKTAGYLRLANLARDSDKKRAVAFKQAKVPYFLLPAKVCFCTFFEKNRVSE